MDIDHLYEQLHRQICLLDEDLVVPHERSDGHSFKLTTSGRNNFTTIHRQKTQLKITLNIWRKELSDPRRMAKSNRTKRRGTAHTKAYLDSTKGMGDIMRLIQQSFKKLAGDQPRECSGAFSIQIAVPQGRVDGLRIINKPNWSGTVIDCPRDSYSLTDDRLREYLVRGGVYILMAHKWRDTLPILLTGHGSELTKQLDDYLTHKNRWQRVIVFTGMAAVSLSARQLEYIAIRLTSLAQQHKRCEILIPDSLKKFPWQPRELKMPPDLAHTDKSAAQFHLAEWLSLMPVLGINAFKPTPSAKEGQTVYHFDGASWNARGFVSDNGFTVLKGSYVHHPDQRQRHFRGTYLELWGQLIDIGVFSGQYKSWKPTYANYEFNSPSEAAAFVKRSTLDIRGVWEDENGNTLEDNEGAG